MTLPTKRQATKIERYDPEKGLQTIAHAQAIERHAKRIRDAKALFKAIEIRLIAIREFVLWWDGAAKKGQGARTDLRDRTVTKSIAGKNGLPERKEIERWRKQTKKEADFRRALEDAQKRCERISRLAKAGTVRGTEGTGEFERYTPALYIEAARKVLGEIDLDPATSVEAQRTVRASKYFTVEADGLAREWHGRVWLNPPYHRELAPAFIAKLIEELAAKRVTAAILLTNNCTDTDWYLQAEAAAQAICFTHGRIKFTDENGTEVLPTQGQAFFYYGPDVQAFAGVFCRIGHGVAQIFAYEAAA